ncbi:hypothetical protein Nepgr_026270 [Nepenthes gracilis]|uniref:UTP23 sensor motif region domain-containing protein n=1 Tax=Nepenthes gracilis TaxID=150966 RepID=A0AAD3T7W8_NEPGR|nr:hypothetical protein Nepgr_026270 [Nepenthes gracilis]
MRLKKQKRHRKIVRFYTACFGFREPFKVLCDGTFIHHLVANHISPHDKAISNALGGSVRLFTTRCVAAELKSLGNSHSDSLKAAQNNFKIASCDHEKRKSAVACIMEIIGQGNSEHFFVATQDTDLRKNFQNIPGVPVIFGLRNTLFLEQPSSFQREFVKSVEEERLHMSNFEYKIFKKRVKERLGSDEVEELSNADERDQILEAQDLIKKGNARKRADVRDKVQFKRKKAKGPNPLSCKKKKKPKGPGPDIEKAETISEEGAKRSRSRNRKKPRSIRKLPAADDNDN